jgi:acetolactate synthase small subunit
VRKQLQKIVHVIKVWTSRRRKGSEREHALVKIK